MRLGVFFGAVPDGHSSITPSFIATSPAHSLLASHAILQVIINQIWVGLSEQGRGRSSLLLCRERHSQNKSLHFMAHTALPPLSLPSGSQWGPGNSISPSCFLSTKLLHLLDRVRVPTSLTQTNSRGAGRRGHMRQDKMNKREPWSKVDFFSPTFSRSPS